MVIFIHFQNINMINPGSNFLFSVADMVESKVFTEVTLGISCHHSINQKILLAAISLCLYESVSEWNVNKACCTNLQDVDRNQSVRSTVCSWRCVAQSEKKKSFLNIWLVKFRHSDTLQVNRAIIWTHRYHKSWNFPSWLLTLR